MQSAEKVEKEKYAPEAASEKASLPQRFGENLTRYRKAAGMTQAQLAALLNYSDKIVSKWERGDGLPDLPTTVALSEILGVSVDTLLQAPGENMSDEKASDVLPSVPQTATEEKNGESTPGRRIFIHLLSSLLPFLVAAAAYATLQMVGATFGGELLFLYAVAASGIVSTVFSCLWWGALPKIISVSLICWGVAFSFWLSLRDLGGAAAIFAAAAVMQVLTVLWFLMPKRKKAGSPSPSDKTEISNG